MIILSKNILIIEGSPRKGGNSDILTDQLIKGAEESNHNTEKIYLTDYKLNYCLGCYACQKGPCVHDDGMDKLIDKMMKAEVIVLATPVYFYSMSGQLKTFIDRTLPKYEEITNKEFYLIATAAVNEGFALERTFEAMRGYLDCLPGAQEKGTIYGVSSWLKGDVKRTVAMEEAYNMGKNI